MKSWKTIPVSPYIFNKVMDEVEKLEYKDIKNSIPVEIQKKFKNKNIPWNFFRILRCMQLNHL